MPKQKTVGHDRQVSRYKGDRETGRQEDMKDRNGITLALGQHIRIQVCVGRYGQTAIRQGYIVKLSPQWGGVNIRTDFAFDEDCGRFGVETRAAGSSVYVTVPQEGYQRHDDFEHGHEKWSEVIA
jgi:hypothetical protein